MNYRRVRVERARERGVMFEQGAGESRFVCDIFYFVPCDRGKKTECKRQY